MNNLERPIKSLETSKAQSPQNNMSGRQQMERYIKGVNLLKQHESNVSTSKVEKYSEDINSMKELLKQTETESKNYEVRKYHEPNNALKTARKLSKDAHDAWLANSDDMDLMGRYLDLKQSHLDLERQRIDSALKRVELDLQVVNIKQKLLDAGERGIEQDDLNFAQRFLAGTQMRFKDEQNNYDNEKCGYENERLVQNWLNKSSDDHHINSNDIGELQTHLEELERVSKVYDKNYLTALEASTEARRMSKLKKADLDKAVYNQDDQMKSMLVRQYLGLEEKYLTLDQTTINSEQKYINIRREYYDVMQKIVDVQTQQIMTVTHSQQDISSQRLQLEMWSRMLEESQREHDARQICYEITKTLLDTETRWQNLLNETQPDRVQNELQIMQENLQLVQGRLQNREDIPKESIDALQFAHNQVQDAQNEFQRQMERAQRQQRMINAGRGLVNRFLRSLNAGSHGVFFREDFSGNS